MYIVLSILLYGSLTQMYIHTYVIFHYVPSQVTSFSPLCCTAGSHCLSTPNARVRLDEPQTPSPSPPLPSPLATTSLFSESMSLFLFCRQGHCATY